MIIACDVKIHDVPSERMPYSQGCHFHCVQTLLLLLIRWVLVTVFICTSIFWASLR